MRWVLWIALVGCARPAAVARVEGLSLPESVLWDEASDVYLVSNLGPNPLAVDDDGWIARVSPETGKVERFIDGTRAEVKLDSPRGMAIVGERLYVADLGSVRMFDRKSGEP